MSLRGLAKALAGAIVLAEIVQAGTPPTCLSNSPLSCHNTTAVDDLCCFNYPSGQLLLVELWETNPVAGPSDHWTMQGLWPDNCDGSLPTTCDPFRQYSNITQILQSFNRTDVLDYMEQYWLNGDGTGATGPNTYFWEHEWGKHGTCINTLSPSCYTDYSPQEEVVDFFARTVSLFQQLPTYQYLAAANIYPSATQNYTYDEVMAALASPRGVNATIECYDGVLDSVYYAFNVIGSVQTGSFVPQNPAGQGVGCPDSLMYLPKDVSSV